MKATFKIYGLFEHAMRSRVYNTEYDGTQDSALKAIKAFYKEKGFNNIIKVINDVLSDCSDINIKVLEKKYNKTDGGRYIKIELINNSNNVNIVKIKELKEVERLINFKLWDYALYSLESVGGFEIQ